MPDSRGLQISRACVCEKQTDQRLLEQVEKDAGEDRDQGRADELIPEYALELVPVALSEVLSTEYPCAGEAAKDAELKYEQKLIGDGYAGHLFRADLPHHNIVQKAHKVGDALLNDDGQHDPQNLPVKILGTDILSHVWSPLKNMRFR